MEATRRKLQARPKILKKLSEPQNNQSKRKSFQKKVCTTLNKKWRKNLNVNYAAKFAGSTQNPKKNLGK
jgi:hypothetical protein